MRSYREWYSCDNLIRDPMPFLEQDGHPAGGASWLAVLNPDAEREASTTITIYSTQPATEPQEHRCTVPPKQTRLIELHTLPGVPRNEFFGVGVTSDIAVIPQVTNYEFRPWDMQPDATISKIMVPGPLKTTEQYFPDGWQGGGPGAQMSWFERETLTLLNPGDDEARVTVTVFSYGRPADVVLWVSPRRLRAISLYDVPGLRFRWIEERQTTMIDYSVRVVSDNPVVAQKTRRAYVQYQPNVQGMWTSFGHPYRLQEHRRQSHAEWYFPGGYVQDVGNYPRSDQDMLGWDLFFTFNPDPERTAHCTATFCYETGDPQVLEFEVEPYRQKLHWLHHEEYRHLTGTNRPYAVKIESDGPLIPHWTRAEYESWGWHNPTAMYGVVPFEGPLTDETDWYYAEGFWQDQEDHPWIEHEWATIYNPGNEDATATATFYLPDGERTLPITVSAGRLTTLRMEELGVVPGGSHYGVHISASRPVVVQQTRRTYKKGGSPSTLSTSAALAMPYKPQAG